MGMNRTGHLFAIASLILLIFGLLLARYVTSVEMALHWPGSRVAYGIPLYTPCYGIGALFALFAGLYTISYVPFAKGVSQWHFWLSFIGVLLFALGYSMLGVLGSREVINHHASQGSLAVMALGFLLGPLAFVFGQLLFVIGLARAVLEIRRH